MNPKGQLCTRSSPTLGEWPAVYLKSGETRLLLGDSSPLNPNGSGQVKALTTEDVLNGPISVTTSIVYERDIYHLAGGCAPWAKAMDDYILLVSASKITPIFHLDRPSAYYRVHASSTSRVTQLALPFLSAGFAFRVSTNEHLTHPQFQNTPMYRQCFTEFIQTGTAEDAKSVIALSMLLLDMRATIHIRFTSPTIYQAKCARY